MKISNLILSKAVFQLLFLIVIRLRQKPLVTDRYKLIVFKENSRI